MNKKLILTLAVALVGHFGFSQLGPINVVSSTSTTTYVTSDGQFLTEGLLRFGLFDVASYDLLTEAEKINFDIVSNLFLEISQVPSDGAGNFNLNSFVITQDIINETGVTVGDKLFTWVTDGPTLGTSTEWGIFSSTNPFWDVKASPAPSVLNAAAIDVFVAGMDSINGKALVPIPEPQAMAVIFGVLALGLAIWRRRR